MRTERESIDQIRRFNRHYVPVMRLLDRSYLDTGMSVLETAALIEIGENEGCSARDIARLLHMDKGHLSRTIRRFVDAGLVSKHASADDARVQLLSLTGEGRRHVDDLAESGADIVAEAFAGASAAQLDEVADAMERVLAVLEEGRRNGE